MLESIYAFDYAILNFLQEHVVCDFLNPILAFFSSLGYDGIFCILLSLVLMCFKRTRKMGCAVAIGIIIGALVTNVTIKPLVARVRPYLNFAYNPMLGIDDVCKMVKIPSDYSFPSGHTTAVFATSVAMLTVSRKWGIPAVCCATLTAFSRLYFYIHYPTDVFVALIIGISAGLIAGLVVKKLDPKYQGSKIQAFVDKIWDSRWHALWLRITKKKENEE